MSDDDNVVSQDEIDNLLEEMQEEEGKDKPKGEGAAEGGEQKDPSENPEAWGLSEDELKEQAESEAAPGTSAGGEATDTAKDVKFEPLPGAEGEPATPRSLEFVLDIPLMLTVEVGRTKMNIGDLLTLGPGSIVELTKMAGEPLEVFVNDKLVARGEAVIVNEKFGIRLTDVISKAERIETLK